MEFLYLLLAFLLGSVITFAITYAIQSSKGINNSQQSELELKSVLAAQAKLHIDTSSNILEEIDARTSELREQLNAYQALLEQDEVIEDDSKSDFFGEHASVYLRNSAKSTQKQKLPEDNNAQPLDFSGDATGIFAGQSDTQKQAKNN